MSWENIVKRKKMRNMYKKLIDEIIEESTRPLYAREILSELWDKIKKYRASQDRFISNRDYPQISAVVQYLQVNYIPADYKSGSVLWGWKRR